MTSPARSAWEGYVAEHGLSGNPSDDRDTDDDEDFVEFAFGGQADDGAIGAQASTLSRESNVVTFIHLERNQASPGIAYLAEWTRDLLTGNWTSVWDEVEHYASPDPDYNRVERRIQVDAEDELYFRVQALEP